MADLNSISKDICKKKNLDRNLSAYISNMTTLYGRFSHIKLSMNYYTFCDVLSEADDMVSRDILKVLASLNGMIETDIVNNSSEKSRKEALKRLTVIRDSVISTMEIVTAYVDRFGIFEHLLNRVEYRFSNEGFDEEHFEGQLVNDVLNFIVSDKDSVVMNGKISCVVEQLPMRLTRRKFFELVQDAFGLYKDQDQSSLADFVYMLKTVSGIYEPQGFSAAFPDLYQLLQRLSGYSYKEMQEEEFQKAQKELEYAVTFLTRTSDLYVQLMEVINDVMIILLARPNAFYESEEAGKCISIIDAVLKQNGKGLDDVDGDITDSFISFEGKQERIYMQISANDYVIDEMENSLSDELKERELWENFESLKKIARLSSGSHFVSLEESQSQKAATEEDVNAAFSDYHEKMAECFLKNAKEYNRAVMSLVLASLPVFFNNMDEIISYVKTSLEQCSDLAEKKATMALLHMLMEEYS